MKLAGQAELLRILIGESDKVGARPLYECIVQEARRLGLAGATVLRGILGFGASSRVHSAKILELSTDLPIVIEIVDETARIEALLPYLDEHVKEGLVTREHVDVILYRHDPARAK